MAVGLTIGLLQATIGHPFDTVKTLLQNGQTFRNLRPTQFYRGVAYPTVSSIAYNMVVFPVFDQTSKQNISPYLAGAAAGMAVAPVDFAFDIGKIRRQTLARGPLHMRGFTISSLRNVMATSVYFGIYFDTKESMGPLLAGSLAGLANWTLTYPLDVCATRQIAQGLRIRDGFRGNLWKGYVPCAMRAILVNSATFYCYEWFQT